MMPGLRALALLAGLALALAAPSPAAAADDPLGYHGDEHAENRVGRAYWARPALSDPSVEFYEEPALRNRVPVYRKASFKVMDLVATRPFPDPDLIWERIKNDGPRAKPH